VNDVRFPFLIHDGTQPSAQTIHVLRAARKKVSRPFVHKSSPVLRPYPFPRPSFLSPFIVSNSAREVLETDLCSLPVVRFSRLANDRPSSASSFPVANPFPPGWSLRGLVTLDVLRPPLSFGVFFERVFLTLWWPRRC